MKEIIKIGNLLFVQNNAAEIGLKMRHLILVSYFNDFILSGKCDTEIIGNDKYFYLSYKKIEQDLPILDIKKRQICNVIDDLIKLHILTPLNRTVGRKKTFYKLNLEKIKHSKYVKEKKLCIVDGTEQLESVKFYEQWLKDKAYEISKNLADYSQKLLLDRFLRVVHKITTQSDFTINNETVSAEDVLYALEGLFVMPTKETINILDDCFSRADKENVSGNKFSYTVVALYNRVQGI